MVSTSAFRRWKFAAVAGLALAASASFGLRSAADDLGQFEPQILAGADQTELRATQRFAVGQRPGTGFEAAPPISDLSGWRLAAAVLGPIAGAALALLVIAALRRSRSKVADSAGKLSQMEQRFKDFADASGDWYWEMDADLRFSYFSDRYYEIVVDAHEMLIGKTRQETGIPDVDPGAWEEHLAALADHRPFRDFVHPRTRDDGAIVWLAISGKPIFDKDDVFQGFRGTGRDVTHRVIRERELAASKVAAETAEAISRQKSDFLANMSHELRTPLNAIIGFSQILGTSGESLAAGERKEFSRNIQSAGEHLLSLVNDLLDIAKIESGKMPMKFEKLDVNESVAMMGKMFATLVGEKEITFNVAVDVAGTRVLADRRRLIQMLINLVSNALKFTEVGGLVSVRCYLDDRRAYVLEVEDSGIGMAPDDIDHAFEKFGQIDSGIARAHEGTGLGLPLTKLLIEHHGGTLQVQSEVGVGTTFTIKFPSERTVEAGKVEVFDQADVSMVG